MKSINDKQAAEDFAIKAFSFIAQDPQILSLFFDITGLSVDSIRDAANSKDFLVGVMNFYSSNESLLISFCQNHNYNPESFGKAFALLSGEKEYFYS